MAIGTTAALILGASMLAATGGSMAYSSAVAAKGKKKAEATADEAKKTAEQKSLMETQEEEKTAGARKAILDLPTSGFGPNKNLARSFLTTL